MKTVTLPLPWLGFTAGTRAALGVGLGLLLAQKMSKAHRRTVGWTLVSLGAATTVPIFLRVFGKRSAPSAERPSVREFRPEASTAP
jgi:hypothetical protein